MKIVRTATAGTLESNDVMVYISPRDEPGLSIELNSIVEKLYGEDIRRTAEKVLKDLGVTQAAVSLDDRGALDFAIKARVETAVMRAGGE
jgi:citrate lyase subunit gamma (acyl carrier protein)